jgi:type II secretory pathway component PulF
MQHQKPLTQNGIKTFLHNNHLNDELILQFTESMSALCSAGMSLQDALSICADISTKKNIASLCRELLQCITDGKRFHDALLQCSPSFSSLYVALITLGENTNSLDKIFFQLAKYLRRNREIKQKMMQALAYPITVCVTAMVITFFIIVFVFPQMQMIFDVFNAGENSADIQQNFQSLKNSMRYIFGTIIVLMISVLILLQMRARSYSISLAADHVVLRIPIIGNIIKIVSASDFSFSMELLCSSGIPFLQALKQSQSIIANAAFQNAIENIAIDIANGMPIGKSFKRQKIFPSYVSSWIGIGEKTGAVEKVFTQLHVYFENESTVLITNITSAAQPIFILVAGTMIMLLVWHFVVPIFSLVGGL